MIKWYICSWKENTISNQIGLIGIKIINWLIEDVLRYLMLNIELSLLIYIELMQKFLSFFLCSFIEIWWNRSNKYLLCCSMTICHCLCSIHIMRACFGRAGRKSASSDFSVERNFVPNKRIRSEYVMVRQGKEGLES